MAEQQHQPQDHRPALQHLAHLRQASALQLPVDGTTQTPYQLALRLHGAQHPWPPVQK